MMLADFTSAMPHVNAGRVTDDTRAAYLANSYRVLLTRARQGMAIYVPAGSDIDDTRDPDFYEQTYAFLCECGITKIAS
jgi:hypothetical protein